MNIPYKQDIAKSLTLDLFALLLATVMMFGWLTYLFHEVASIFMIDFIS